MVRKHISLLFLVLSLAHMSLTHTFGASGYAESAYKGFVAVVSHVGSYTRQHPFIVASLSVVAMACIGFLWKKSNEILGARYRDQLEYYRIRNGNRGIREMESKNETSSDACVEPMVIDAKEVTVTTDEVSTLVTPVATDTVEAIDDTPVEPVVVARASEPSVTMDEVPASSEDTNKMEHATEPVERKTLVTVEIMPLYEPSGGSYDAYLQ
jgi:hypothetical protein